MFRNLYSLAMDPMGRVFEAFDEESNILRPWLRRNLNDWEIDDFGSLLALLEGIKPNPSMGNSWEWVISKRYIITPKSLYLELGGFTLRLIRFLLMAFGSRVFRQK